jgi:hypothetical protein
MKTTFNITCGNWLDPDLPMTHEYAYTMNGVRTVFLTRTARNLGETIISGSQLPIGDLNRDNVLDIYVNIKDKFEGATEQHFTVKVVMIRSIKYIYKHENTVIHCALVSSSVHF